MIKNKIIDRINLIRKIQELPKPIVFTNGVFDILHSGHVRYLEDAKSKGNTLIVAINSDSSVRSLNKSPERPINNLANRSSIIAALESVDYVTSFNENSPYSLIKDLKPDLYLKGGDYKIEELEEAKLVSSWGGQAILSPFHDGFSTTSLIKKIKLEPQRIDIKKKTNKAVFLDRDGVINKDTGYVSKCEDFIFIESVTNALSEFARNGYKLIVVTNQSGIGRGYFEELDFLKICSYMNSHLIEKKIFIDAIYYCPHHPNSIIDKYKIVCNCRKPECGMITKASQDLGIDLKSSILIGDKLSDMQAAQNAGIPYRYFINNKSNYKKHKKLITKSFNSLWECAKSHLSIDY